MTSSSDLTGRSGTALRPSSRVLRGDAVDGAQVAPFAVEVPHNRRSTDRMPPLAEQLASARREGWDDGYRAGLEAAKGAAEVEHAEALRRAGEAIAAAVAAVAAGRAESVAVVQRDATELAFELTGALLDRELATAASPGLDAVRRALALTSPGLDLSVRLHPDQLVSREELAPLAPDCRLVVVADPDIELGGCVIDAGPCRIDAQMSAALDRVRAVLLDALDGPSAPEGSLSR